MIDHLNYRLTGLRKESRLGGSDQLGPFLPSYLRPQLPPSIVRDNLLLVGKRSGIIDHEDGLAGLSLAELDREIARCRMRIGIAANSRQRKGFESRIH